MNNSILNSVALFSLIAVPAYLISSIPFGLVLTKIFLKKDVREIGSGNIGATNVLRTGSKTLALFTVILDALKPILSVFISILVGCFILYLIDNTNDKFSLEAFSFILVISLMEAKFISIIVLSSVIGHIFPIYLKFKGGKGVATAFGSLFLITKWIGPNIPILPLTALAIWLTIAFIFKKSSLAALISLVLTLIAIPFMQRFDEFWILYTYIFTTGLIIYRHKDNIKRLLNGTESNINLKKSDNKKSSSKKANKK